MFTFTAENFTYQAFIDHVMEKLKLNDAEPDVKSKIEKELLRTLGNRILLSVMHAMTDDDIKTFEMIRTANPDMSDYEIIYAIVDEVPALHEVMMKNINDLLDELTYDAQRLDEVLEEKKQNKK
jgi:hypothetical protein